MVQFRTWNACFATKLHIFLFAILLLGLSALKAPTVVPSYALQSLEKKGFTHVDMHTNAWKPDFWRTGSTFHESLDTMIFAYRREADAAPQIC